MPKGVKKPCRSPGCTALQEGFNDCYLCASHGVNCRCAFHRRKRTQRYRTEQQKMAIAIKKRKHEKDNSAAPSHEDGLDSICDDNFHDDCPHDFSREDEEQHDLDMDGLDFLQKLENPVRWTRVESNCICFPDMVLRDGTETELDEKSFVHVYLLTRNWGSVTRSVVASDCGCDYALRMNSILLGGFDSSLHTFEEIREEFGVGLPCVHTW
jgi:hypothetical protein